MAQRSRDRSHFLRPSFRSGAMRCGAAAVVFAATLARSLVAQEVQKAPAPPPDYSAPADAPYIAVNVSVPTAAGHILA